MAYVIDYLDNLEIGLCLRINRFGRVQSIRGFFALVSRLGDGTWWAAMGVLLLAANGESAWPVLAHFAATAAVGVAIYKLLKRFLVRERPFVHDGGILCGTAPLDEYSFPSGHTLHAVAFTILYTQAEPLLFFLCAPFALLVAVSRVVLGLHYPSDVVVGAALGAALAMLSIAWL